MTIPCKYRSSPAVCRAWYARLGVCAALLGAGVAAFAADDWTQEGQDAGAASSNSAQTLLNPGNLGQLVTLWSLDLDTWWDTTSIVLADGQVYVGRTVADPASTLHQQLVRLDLETGATVWTVNAPERFNTPVLTQDLVIVAGAVFGLPGNATRVRAYDRATGQLRWEYAHPLPSSAFRAPHLLDGVLYLVSLNGDTLALDAATGEVRWHRDQDNGRDCCSTHGLAVADGVVLIDRSKGLLALDAADGHLRWRYDLPWPPHSVAFRPMIVNGAALMFDLDGKVHSLDLATGAVRWVVSAPPGDDSYPIGPMASDGERIFVLAGTAKPRLSALDAATGATLWSTRRSIWTHSPIVSNGVLYLATDLHLKAVDPASGADLPIARLKTMRYGNTVIANGHILISGGPVRAFGLAP